MPLWKILVFCWYYTPGSQLERNSRWLGGFPCLPLNVYFKKKRYLLFLCQSKKKFSIMLESAAGKLFTFKSIFLLVWERPTIVHVYERLYTQSMPMHLYSRGLWITLCIRFAKFSHCSALHFPFLLHFRWLYGWSSVCVLMTIEIALLKAISLQ